MLAFLAYKIHANVLYKKGNIGATMACYSLHMNFFKQVDTTQQTEEKEMTITRIEV